MDEQVDNLIEQVDNLIFDGNNICHINYHVNKNYEEDLYIGLTLQGILMQLKMLHKKFNPKRTVIAFDDHSWRKLYTKDIDQCHTHKKYKGTRRQGMTKKEKERFDNFESYIPILRDMLAENTSIIVLSKKWLEADDLISAFIERHPDENHTIVSSDKDFMQLICDNVKLFTPIDKGSYRDLSEYQNDRKLFLFEKCFRGDAGDNVISSYPKLRQTKIFAAYTDDFIRNNLMNHTFSVEELHPVTGDIITHQYVTKDLFEENEHLMALDKQPDYIREMMFEVVDEALENTQKFSMFKFLKFCGKHGLTRIVSSVNSFIPLFNS